MFGEWKVQIIDYPGYARHRVFLYQLTREGQMFIRGDSTNVLVKEGDVFNDEDLRFADMSDEQVQAFANAFSQRGVKTTNDSKNEGLLEATKAHLEDMRTLVFKKGTK